MAKTLSCRDIGVACDWHTSADTEEEVLRQTAMHTKEEHGMTDIPEDMVEEVRAAIKEGPCPTSMH